MFKVEDTLEGVWVTGEIDDATSKLWEVVVHEETRRELLVFASSGEHAQDIVACMPRCTLEQVRLDSAQWFVEADDELSPIQADRVRTLARRARAKPRRRTTLTLVIEWDPTDSVSERTRMQADDVVEESLLGALQDVQTQINDRLRKRGSEGVVTRKVTLKTEGSSDQNG